MPTFKCTRVSMGIIYDFMKLQIFKTDLNSYFTFTEFMKFWAVSASDMHYNRQSWDAVIHLFTFFCTTFCHEVNDLEWVALQMLNVKGKLCDELLTQACCCTLTAEK